MTDSPSYPDTASVLCPCPFCGGAAEFADKRPKRRTYVFCQVCDTRTKTRQNARAAAEHWNSRGVAQAAWQPIETVPENNFTVLVYGKYGRLTAFRDEAWQWWPFPAGEPLDYIPTHWMLMPEAPVVSSTHHSATAMEGELDTVVQLIHKHVDVRDLFDGAQELIGVEDAAKAILSALSSTDPRCTCAAIVNPNIPHARFCPLSSTSRDSASTYCALCDHEHQLHEDAQGFHHVVKGARVACPFPTESK